MSLAVSILFSTAFAAAPVFPPPGFALVEVKCERCVEDQSGWFEARFYILRSSNIKLIGQRFDVVYRDLATYPPKFSGIFHVWLPAFALDDRAYFWVRELRGQVRPVTDQQVARVTPTRHLFMYPIREQSARAHDGGLVRTSADRKRLAEQVMQIVGEKDREKRAALLRAASESEDRYLAGWAKWVREKYYPPQLASGPARPAAQGTAGAAKPNP